MSSPGLYSLSLIIAIRAQERAYRNNFIGKIGSTYIFRLLPRITQLLPQKSFFRFLCNMLDILSGITGIVITWDEIVPKSSNRNRRKTETMDTRTETDSLALDYAKGTLNTIEAERALGHQFGLCEHEEHDFHADAYDWLEDVLDIQYLVSSDRQYLGARLLLSWGGPNTWLDTKTGAITVYWGSDSATVYAPQSFTDALDEALAELWEMGN